MKNFIFILSILLNLSITLLSADEDCLAPNQTLSYKIINHISVLNEKGYNFDFSKLKNSRYDRFGYLLFDYYIHEKKSYITFSFEQSNVFDIDGDAETLIYYLENFINYSSDNLSSQYNSIVENLRYLVFKRLVKFRNNAKAYLPTIKKYLSENNERSSKVRDEVSVAVRMIEDDNSTINPGGKRLNTWFISYEVAPFIKKGGLGDVAGTLPRVIRNKRGHNVGAIMPYWSVVDDIMKKNPELKPKLRKDIPPFYIDGYVYSIYEAVVDNTPVFLLKNVLFEVEKDAVEKGLPLKEINLIKNDIYRKDLDRGYGEHLKGLYGEDSMEYAEKRYEIHPENAKRAVRFSQASLKAIELLSKSSNVSPDIVVTADWQSGLLPALIKNSNNSFFNKTKTVHTIHNLLFKGLFNKDNWNLTGLNTSEFKKDDFMDGEFYGYASLMKLGIVHSDSLITVSPNYAKEIQTKENGQGLDGLFKVVGIKGIINGIPRRELNSYVMSEGVSMTQNPDEYDRKLGVMNIPQGKEANKHLLQKEFKLNENGERVPLITFVGRLTEQKGLDKLLPVIKSLLENNKAQFLIVGEGDSDIEGEFKVLMEKYKGNFHWEGGFISESLVKKIYAGSDLMAMPSKEEPCGLSQLQAMRYGCIPVVFDVGGLHDTVFDFYDNAGNENVLGNGYVVKGDLSSANLSYIFNKALNDYNNIAKWDAQVLKTLFVSDNFSWENSAEEYESIFYQLVGHYNYNSKLSEIAA